MTPRRLTIALLAAFLAATLHAQEQDTTLLSGQHPRREKRGVFHAIGKAFTKVFRGFNDIDTAFIEPQHYNYTVMLQNTNTYEAYTIVSKSGQRFTFSPDWSAKVGPYAGWRWLFLGYTFDVKHIESDNRKREFDLSLYSSMLGIDLYYRKTGNNYNISKATIKDDNGRHALKDVPFDGLSASIKGFDLYYIFNHRRFSYPAAFSQSTRQKRSCGSPLIGIGYTRHSLSLDYDKLKAAVNNSLSATEGTGNEVEIDPGLSIKNVKYESYSISGGYAYNWVFARNLLFSSSISVGLAYKRSRGDDTKANGFSLESFSFKNFNADAIGRFGLVWNNDKWYAGASTIWHAYTYRKSMFSANNYFGSLNIYAGVNIGAKRAYRKNKK